MTPTPNICQCGDERDEHNMHHSYNRNCRTPGCPCPSFRPAPQAKSGEEVPCANCYGINGLHLGNSKCPCSCHPKQTPKPESMEKVLYCDGGKECPCTCHQKDYPLPKDFPTHNEASWEIRFDAEFYPFIAYREKKVAADFSKDITITAAELEHCENKIKVFIHALIAEKVKAAESAKDEYWLKMMNEAIDADSADFVARAIGALDKEYPNGNINTTCNTIADFLRKLEN